MIPPTPLKAKLRVHVRIDISGLEKCHILASFNLKISLSKTFSKYSPEAPFGSFSFILVSPVNTKIGFIRLPYSQNNCKPCSLLVGLARIWKSCWNCMTLIIYFLPPPPPHLTSWYEGRTIILSSDKRFFSTQCFCHPDLWQHSGSHLITSIIFNISPLLLYIPWEVYSFC